MSLIRCPECNHEVSDKAAVCPHCGVDLQKELKAQKRAELSDKMEDAADCAMDVFLVILKIALGIAVLFAVIFAVVLLKDMGGAAGIMIVGMLIAAVMVWGSWHASFKRGRKHPVFFAFSLICAAIILYMAYQTI